MTKISVLFLVEHLSDGGSERHIHDVASLLDAERFTPHVVYFQGGLMSHRLARQVHVRTRQFPPLKKSVSLASLQAIGRLRRYIQQNHIQIVFTFHFLADLLGATTALSLPRLAVVSSRRDMGTMRSSLQRLVGRVLRFRINKYVAVSLAVKAALARQECVPQGKIIVIYNGADVDNLVAHKWNRGNEREARGIGRDEVVVGCVANFNPVKGHRTLIEAFSRLRERLPDQCLHLLLAGDGPMRGAIEDEVRQESLLADVIFVGHSPDPIREYEMSDIVVSPSETEGFSNTIVEAMALGKPVVATAVGGTPEAIEDGVSGLLIPPGDPSRLAEALERLVVDPDLGRRLGAQAARDARERFDRRRMIASIERLIVEVTGD